MHAQDDISTSDHVRMKVSINTNLGTVVGSGIYRASQTPEVAYIDDGSANGRIYVRGMTDDVPSANKMFTSGDYGATWTLVDAPLTVKDGRHLSNPTISPALI